MIKLSVIIPIYRVEPWLRPCLDSVLLPGREDYEVIAVDDGSPDGCGAILEEYAGRFPGLLRVIRQSNSGLGAARNAGLALARGDDLLFLDGDDMLSPGAMEEILALPEPEAEVLVFDFYTVTQDGRLLSRTAGCSVRGRVTLAQHPELLLDPPNVWNKLWRRDLFLRSGIRFPDRLWYEDLAAVPCLYRNAESICAVHRPWLRYRLRRGSVTHSGDLQRNRQIIPAVDTVLDDFQANGQLGQYGEALEAMAVFHQLLTATVRVNRLNPRSPLQEELLENLEAKFPHWRENPLLRGFSPRHRLLLYLIRRRQYTALSRLMALNDGLRRPRTRRVPGP